MTVETEYWTVGPDGSVIDPEGQTFLAARCGCGFATMLATPLQVREGVRLSCGRRLNCHGTKARSYASVGRI